MDEKMREAFKRFAEETTGWHLKDTKIKKISVRTFNSRIKKYITSDICVGEELDGNIFEVNHAPVAGIFESDNYFIVAPDRGRINRTVFLFEDKEVLGVERENL
ncbi:MAG: hypothetical protein MUC39_03465 [Candidatus Omnitrophica bacterium]|jgi:hypothetical protein|nr:hypothetical protein [Candidatus Omnitrophota bacterium]